MTHECFLQYLIKYSVIIHFPLSWTRAQKRRLRVTYDMCCQQYTGSLVPKWKQCFFIEYNMSRPADGKKSMEDHVLKFQPFDLFISVLDTMLSHIHSQYWMSETAVSRFITLEMKFKTTHSVKSKAVIFFITLHLCFDINYSFCKFINVWEGFIWHKLLLSLNRKNKYLQT